jgi:hypothetical protein
MAVELQWYDAKKSILTVLYPDDWTWEDFNAALDQGRAMIESVEHPVSVIHYSRSGMTKLPRGSALPHLKRSAELRPKNLFASYIVVKYPTVRNFIQMLIKMIPANRQRNPNLLVGSVEEALAQIAKTSAG